MLMVTMIILMTIQMMMKLLIKILEHAFSGVDFNDNFRVLLAVGFLEWSIPLLIAGGLLPGSYCRLTIGLIPLSS